MESILNNIDVFINEVLLGLGIYGPILGCILIVIESILPFLPLCVFITILFISYGPIFGFILSWIFTLVGCNLSYFLSKKFLKNQFNKKFKKYDKIAKITKIIENLTFEQLALIVAIPFTPAFLVNIASGITETPYKKYFWAMFIGKIFMVYFWGFVGLTFMECLQNPISFIKILILLLIAFVLSKIINKKFKLE